MNKFLRYSLSLVLAFVASVTFAGTYTYNFTDKTFSATGEKKDLGGINWTVTTDASYFGFDNNGTKGVQVGSKKSPATTLKLSTSEIPGKISSIKVNTSGASGIAATLDVTVGGKAFGSQYTLTTSNATDAEFTGEGSGEIILSYSNTAAAIYFAKIEVTTDDASIGGTETPEVTYTDVASVKDLLANNTAATANLNLKLTNAKVLYVNTYNGTVNTYVREGDAAIELRTLGFDMPVNSIINGTVKVDLKYSYDVPYLVANDGTDDESLEIAASTEAAEPVVATVADILAKKYLNDLVTIKDFTFSKEEYQTGKYNYYANDGESKIMLYDKFSNVGGVADLTEGKKYTVVGIFGAIFKSVPEILPVQAISDTTTGISAITTDAAIADAPAYNLAGQKVSKAYKGVVIKAGKKMIQK